MARVRGWLRYVLDDASTRQRLEEAIEDYIEDRADLVTLVDAANEAQKSRRCHKEFNRFIGRQAEQPEEGQGA